MLGRQSPIGRWSVTEHDSALQTRIDAVEEIINTNSYHMEKLRSLLVNMPDLVKGLTRVQYGKVSPANSLSVLY